MGIFQTFERLSVLANYNLHYAKNGLVSLTMTKVLFTQKSGNKKLGPIPTCLVQQTTCPSTCPLKSNGCYAKSGAIGYHWRRVETDGLPWGSFLDKVRALPEGQIWRYGGAGDLPGENLTIDEVELAELIQANSGRRGFTYTHKPLTVENLKAITAANSSGLTVNISAWDAADADVALRKGAGPVVCLIPWGTPDVSKTPDGATVIACPAQTRDDVTCLKCKLCADPKRKVVIGFSPHGSGQGRGGKSVNERLK